MRAVNGSTAGTPGRWVWAVSGLATALVLTVPALRLVTHSSPTAAFPGRAEVRTFAVPQKISSVDVVSDGSPVRITAGNVPRVQVTIAYHSKAGVPAGPGTVSGGRLTLSDAGCDGGGWCADAFTLTVPRGISADVSTRGGPATVSGLSGTLRADTGGGPLNAQDLASADVSVTTGGGPAALGFRAAPRTVAVSSAGGPARIRVPGGPYALNADSGGGPETASVAADPAAGRALLISTGGGPLLVGPPSG